MNTDHAREIKLSLSDPRAVLERLGLLGAKKTFQRQAAGYLILCPVHDERTPSCSVQCRNGVLLWHCHGCSESGDVLTLVAKAHGLTMRGDDFRQVMIIAAEMGGLHGLVRELEDGTPVERPAPIVRAELPPEPEREYPPLAEVMALIASCVPVDEDPEVSAWVAGRSLSPEAVAGADVAWALPKTATLPRWAAKGGVPWTKTGHRLIFGMHDAHGALRSVRGGRVIDGDTPKRLPPGGHKSGGLVMACALAVGMLRGTFVPERVLILEGEPDFLTWVSRAGMDPRARIGITSGSWTEEVASRIPRAATVTIRTDNDKAGNDYAAAIAATLRTQKILRSQA